MREGLWLREALWHLYEERWEPGPEALVLDHVEPGLPGSGVEVHPEAGEGRASALKDLAGHLRQPASHSRRAAQLRERPARATSP